MRLPVRKGRRLAQTSGMNGLTNPELCYRSRAARIVAGFKSLAGLLASLSPVPAVSRRVSRPSDPHAKRDAR